MSNDPDVRRVPIAMGENAIALLTLFKFPHGHIDDMWAIDWLHEEAHTQHKKSSQQFIDAMEGHWSPAFLMALRDRITETLAAHDKECGTKWSTTIGEH